MFPCSKSYLVIPAVYDGLVQEVTQPCHYQKTGPVGIMEWPSSLLTSRQIHFVFITYSSSSWNWPLSTAAVTGHLCPIIFKWLYFKHLVGQTYFLPLFSCKNHLPGIIFSNVHLNICALLDGIQQKHHGVHS